MKRNLPLYVRVYGVCTMLLKRSMAEGISTSINKMAHGLLLYNSDTRICCVIQFSCRPSDFIDIAKFYQNLLDLLEKIMKLPQTSLRVERSLFVACVNLPCRSCCKVNKVCDNFTEFLTL